MSCILLLNPYFCLSAAQNCTNLGWFLVNQGKWFISNSDYIWSKEDVWYLVIIIYTDMSI